MEAHNPEEEGPLPIAVLLAQRRSQPLCELWGFGNKPSLAKPNTLPQAPGCSFLPFIEGFSFLASCGSWLPTGKACPGNISQWLPCPHPPLGPQARGAAGRD